MQLATSGLVRIDTQVHALVADCNLLGNLLRTPLQSKVEHYIAPDLSTHASGVAAALRSLGCLAARLLSAVPALTTTAVQFAADGAAASTQQAGNLADGVIGFQETVDLVSFFSAEVHVHRATWTWRFERP